MGGIAGGVPNHIWKREREQEAATRLEKLLAPNKF